jgi:DNA repair protein SbcC/Rad50
MIFKRFFKPKWQHADAAVRQQAIAELNSDDQAHKSVLHELAFNDGAEAVRKAALIKLNDFSLWWQASKHDTAERVQQLAEQTLIAQLVQNQVEPKLKQQFIAQCNRSSLLEQLAQTETDAEIKFNLLQRLNKAELNQKALQDNVLQLAQKRQILADINDEKLLEKLARQLDGELLADVQQKLTLLNEQKQKPVALRKQLTLLLAKFNALRERFELAQLPEQLAHYQAQWQQLQPDLPCLPDEEAHALQAKYDKICSQLQHWLEPRLAELEKQRLAAVKSTEQAATARALELQISALEQELQQTIVTADISGAQQLEQQLQQLSAALAAADISDSRPLSNRLNQLQQQLAQLPQLAEQLTQLTRIVADWAAQQVPTNVIDYQQVSTQLQQWQQNWRAISKALPIAVPDSLQQAKVSLQKQWQDAEKAFSAESDKVQRQCRSKLAQYRRLYAAGKYKVLFGLFKGIEQDYAQLTAPQQAQLGKDYEFARDKIAELADWQEYIATPRKQQLLQQVQQLPTLSAADSDSQIRQRADEVKRARAQWNSLGKADPAQEIQLNAAFDSACEQAFAPCREYFAAQDALRAEHVKVREQIIDSAIALAQNTLDSKALAAQLQQLKQAWQQAGAVDKPQFSALNERFNLALEPLRAQLNAEQQQIAQQKQQLIAKAQSALTLDEPNITAKVLKECQQQWKTLGQAARKQDQALWTEFRALCDGFFTARAEQFEQQKQAEQAELEQFSAELSTLTAALQHATTPTELAVLQQQLQLLQPHSSSAQQAWRQLREQLRLKQQHWLQQQEQRELASLFEILADPDATAEQLPASYRDAFARQQEQQFSRQQLTLALEIICNVASPQSESTQRQQVQLLLLSDKHNQGNTLDKLSLLKRWLQFGALQQAELPLLARIKPLFC